MGRKEWYRPMSKGDKEIPGCMSGMFHLFDFRHSIIFSPSSNNTHNFNTIHSISSPQLHPQLKGVEAPRNSLELDESAAAKTTSAAEEYYGVPFGIRVQKKKKDLALLVEEEKRSSSPRTPNLVAKLMGLDMIPDDASTPKLEVNRSQTHSPRVSTTKKNNNSATSNRKPLQRKDTNVMGSRSLPDTPRVSSERFRDGDPRLSFQINKENVNVNVNRATYLCDVQSLPPSPTHNYTSTQLRRSRDGCNSSRVSNNNGYAKEIVPKQVKENVSSKSRRTRVVDEKKVVVESNYSTEAPKLPKQELSSIPYYRRGEKEKEKDKAEEKKVRKFKKASCEKFTERIKRQPPPCEVATQSEALFGRIGKHKTISLCNISANFSVSTKNGCGCSGNEKTKSIASSIQSPLPVGRAKVSPVTTQDKLCITGSREQDPEFMYIKSMMENYCNNTNSRTIRFSWYSPSLPINPLVFHHLEFSRTYNSSNSLQHKCNRKLLFNLVQEILADFLNMNEKESLNIYKDELLEIIWSRIKRFPLSNCLVIEDIDALVARDLSEANIKQLLSHQLVVSELEAIAFEIEDHVIDSVVKEVVACVGWV